MIIEKRGGNPPKREKKEQIEKQKKDKRDKKIFEILTKNLTNKK